MLEQESRFEVRRQLGSGGIGTVFEVLDRERGAVVALETMHLASPSMLYAFKREFRSLADISHPRLVGLHELIAVEGGASGRRARRAASSRQSASRRCDWRNEPLSGGCPAAVPAIGAFAELAAALRAPVGRVHFAGSETATDWVGGYVNGAPQSGERAGIELLEAEG